MRPCPICSKPAEEHYRPFCSRRCADVDLQRWFSESYSLSGPAEPPDEEGKPPSRSAGQASEPPV
ncbi:MAG TPA: DNA gyrase inhibitor YacG [Caulobacteraceae bacterium]